MVISAALNKYEDILDDLFAIKHGEHDLIILYEDIKIFGKVYSKYCKYLLDAKNHAVLLIIFSEDESTILGNLKQEGIDTDKRRKDGSLLIEDAALDFLAQNLACFITFHVW